MATSTRLRRETSISIGSLAWASRSRLAPFVRLARTIRRDRHGILVAIRVVLSNQTAAWKGLNSRIRLISHRSLGFHSAAPLISLVYVCCAAIVISLPRRPSPSNRSEHHEFETRRG
jgi:transposase